MLDLKTVRSEFDRVLEALKNRRADISSMDRFQELETSRREGIQRSEQLKNRRNTVSQEVARLKKNGDNADSLIDEMRGVNDEIKSVDEQLALVETELNDIMLRIPNIPHTTVPIGASEEDNIEVRRIGEQPAYDFTPKAHWELAEMHGILDFERAGVVSGARFVFYRGWGARLERALINFMMDLHSDEHGYEEFLPPYLVNATSLYGTGQLPKFEQDLFKIENSPYYLIPTAEVPLTNFWREQILSPEQLPVQMVGYSACFRSEAGAAGRDTRGLIRQHQFNKVELVHLVAPEASYAALEQLTGNAERILQKLNLPYRVLSLCTGDMGFSSAKTYDLEVWLPSASTYREISSCSNFEDFQARRAGIRFRRDLKAKPEFVHTLNGSGLAIGRTVAAILENGQQADGSIRIPAALVPYMGGKSEFTIS